MKTAALSLLALVLLTPAGLTAADAPASETPTTAEGYTSPRVDFGIVVSNAEKSATFYRDVLGMTEARAFELPGEPAAAIGLTAGSPVVVRVMTLGDGPAATGVKLVTVPATRPARPDNRFIESTYGVRYLTLHVADLAAALERAKAKGVKPIAAGPTPLPESIAPGLGLAVLRDPDGNLIELVGPFTPKNDTETTKAPETAADGGTKARQSDKPESEAPQPRDDAKD